MLRRRSASTSTTVFPSFAIVRMMFMERKVLPSDAWQLVSMIFFTFSPAKDRLVHSVFTASLQA